MNRKWGRSFQDVGFHEGVRLQDFCFSTEGQVSGKDGGMPESVYFQSDASVVQVGTVSVGVRKRGGVQGGYFEKVLFPGQPANDFADGNVAIGGFVEELLPFLAAGVECTAVGPDFLDGKHAQQAGCSAKVVLVGVRDDKDVQFLYPDMMQERDNDVLARMLSSRTGR